MRLLGSSLEAVCCDWGGTSWGGEQGPCRAGEWQGTGLPSLGHVVGAQGGGQEKASESSSVQGDPSAANAADVVAAADSRGSEVCSLLTESLHEPYDGVRTRNTSASLVSSSWEISQGFYIYLIP